MNERENAALAEEEVLLFAVFATRPGRNYTQTKAAAQAFFDTVDGAHGGSYTTLTEYFGGQSTPNGTKVSVAFMDPSDRHVGTPEAGTLLVGESTITEEEWALDGGWSPPPGAVGAEVESAMMRTELGKRALKTKKKTAKPPKK